MPGFFSFSGAVIPLCEIGMGDPRAAEPSSWLDVSCYVHEAELFRGRERFNDHFEPGTASITFKNDNGWADLTGDSTAVVDRPVRPGRHIRIGVIGPFDGGPDLTRWLWRGFIDQAVPDYDPVEEDVVTLHCVDAFGEAGMPELLTSSLVGVNETVGDRINRALDAVGWWGAKRSVATGTALLQGTTMGGRSTDMMTRAADSAGGVVFGDVDGNVVYRDIDWMLYDPDTPPDGEIGNCDPSFVGTPVTLPYHDPTQGPVEVVNDIPTHPAVTKFCLGPSDKGGRIIERGEAYYVEITKAGDGLQHLYLVENGVRWDLGVWEPDDGCVTITHPSPGGGPPTAGKCPPGTIDLDCTPVIITTGCRPGLDPDCTTEAPTWDVEFIGYSDGGLDDGPQSSVTVSGLAPGPGAMLVVLINAICNDLPSGTLRPFPVAGGSITGAAEMTFEDCGYAVAGGDGAETYGAITRTPRNDPGTFDIVVDWAGANESKYHIVTVWKLTLERPDLYDRMNVEAYLHVFNWNRLTGTLPADPPPGKGPQHIFLADPSTDTPPYPSPTDVVIAQSLAESPTPPWGATFDDAGGGAWWTPEFADPPAPTLLAAGSGFSDDFIGAAGALSASWTVAATGPSHGPLVLDGAGAAVGQTVGTDFVGYYSFYATPVTGDYFAEVQIAAMGGGGGGANQLVSVLVNFDLATFTGLEWSYVISTSSPGDGNLRRNTWVNGLLTASAVQDHIDTPAILRVEKTGDTYKFQYLPIGGAGYVTADQSEWPEFAAGDHVGMRASWDDPAPVSPRIDGFEVGALGVVCDDFDRPDGDIGPDWILGQGTYWTSGGADGPVPLVISDGAAVASVISTDAEFHTSTMYRVEKLAADQSIEVEVEHVWAGYSGYVELYLSATGTDFAAVMLACTFEAGFIDMGVYGFAPDGNHWVFPQPGAAPTHDSTEPVTIRFATDGVGNYEVFLDDASVLTWTWPEVIPSDPSFPDVTIPRPVGPYAGVGLYAYVVPPDGVAGATRILSACVGSSMIGGIVRKCSWVAGYRPILHPFELPATTSPEVDWLEVNLGPDEIQSCQCAVVVSPNLADTFSWHVLANYASGPTSPTVVPPMTHSSTVRYQRNSMIVVMVAAFAGSDIAAGISVSSTGGLSFTSARTQGKVGASHGQGAVFTAITPELLVASDTINVSWGASLEGVSYVIMEVTNGGTVGAVGSTTVGTHTLGSVDGAVSTPLSATTADTSVVLGYLGVLGDPTTTGGDPGTGWIQEVEYFPAAPNDHTWFLVESNAGVPQTTVAFNDMMFTTTTGPKGSDAVVLGVEITPGPEFTSWEVDDTIGVTIGGTHDAYGGPIYGADQRNGDGSIIWQFHPGDFV